MPVPTPCRALAWLAVPLALASALVVGAPEAGAVRRFDRPLPNGNGRGPLRPPRIVLPPRLVVVPSCEAETTDGETLALTIAAPLPSTVVSGYEPCPTSIEVTGSATLGLPRFDIYFVIDSSGSTGACTGSDIDGDGEIGFPFGFPTCSDLGDTVLAAEVRAVRDFVDTLSPAVTRVAIIQFSMPEELIFGSRQRIVQSLTDDFSLVDAALDEVLLFGSAGATDYAGGLDLLADERLANGQPATRRQLAYFLSDGVPTYPAGSLGAEEPPDSEASIDAADVLASLGISVDTFGVGFFPSVTQDPVIPQRCLHPDTGLEVSTLECVALRTGGVFFASNDPAEIVDALQQRQPAGVAEVLVANETTGDTVIADRTPDGTYSADVPLVPGELNELRVTVTADDGTTCEAVTDVLSMCFSDGCDPRTQGYWHRQCLGMGLIPTGGLGPPPHPDWDPAELYLLMQVVVDPLVRSMDSPDDETTCEGLDAVPPSDPCQRAIKQVTAVLMNIHGGRLGPSCTIEWPGFEPMTPEEAAGFLMELVRLGLQGEPGACQQANDLADLINTGDAVH